MATSGSWLAVGGANLDIKGEAVGPLLMGTSNPGIVQRAPGGVARNVAENLAYLDEEIILCALVGEDSDGEWLRQVTAGSGVSTVGMLRLTGQRTGRYVAVHNEQGDLVAAITDMEINEVWAMAHICLSLELIEEKKVAGIFLDANLPDHILDILLEAAVKHQCLLVIDPVSIKKAEKWIGKMNGVTLAIPSRDEAAVLSGIAISTRQDVEKAAELIHGQGVNQVCITAGTEGVYLHHAEVKMWLPAVNENEHQLDLTGAGEAFLAGVMYGLTRTDSVVECTAYGMVMANRAIKNNWSPIRQINSDILEYEKEKYLRQIGW